MKARLGGKDGSVLLLVVIITSVFIILGIGFMSAAMQELKTGKASENIDYAYLAAESGVERTFDQLKQLCDQPATSNKGTYNPGDLDSYSRQIVTYLDGQITKDPVLIDVADTGKTNEATFTVGSIKYVEKSAVLKSQTELTMKIGVTSVGQLTKGINNSGNKSVYAEKNFTIKLPLRFDLNGAIYAIGDLLSNGSNTTITGDVNVLGTTPYSPAGSNQEQYGGIYAKNASTLDIDGNAYTRSFIRAGAYNPSDDNSTIYIHKDAVAQCLQIFGGKDKIAVFRDAFTFDDLEVDGINSILAVNRNYFGLSSGNGLHHDDSSAIVNAAPVHFPDYMTEAMNSRIVVNGAVMVNGGTFKLASDGSALGVIEDASLATSSDGTPYYKSWNYSDSEIKSDWQGYKESLEANYKDGSNNQQLFGYGNIFQRYTPIMNPTKNDIDNWLSNITSKTDNKFNYDPTKIYGFCNRAFASNNKIFFMENGDQTNAGITGLPSDFTKNFSPDNIKIDDYTFSGVKMDWNTFWAPIYNLDGNDTWWTKFRGGSPLLTHDNINGKEIVNNDVGAPQKLEDLKTMIKPLTEIFATRDYNYGSNVIADTGYSAIGNSTTVFQALCNSFDDLGLDREHNIINLRMMGATGDLGGIKCYSDPTKSIYDDCADNGAYYLIVNDDPKVTITVNGKFNGLIFSMGQVKIAGGADITGSIIASGAANGKSFADVNADGILNSPKINGNADALEDGTNAAVYITGNAKITFNGKDPLLNGIEASCGKDIRDKLEGFISK
ncbi:MAG: hypothetical protein Q8920_08795 [Bacillota bacterium]|nr:hypothetical protein [Bacillota bacterium]